MLKFNCKIHVCSFACSSLNTIIFQLFSLFLICYMYVCVYDVFARARNISYTYEMCPKSL